MLLTSSRRDKSHERHRHDRDRDRDHYRKYRDDSQERDSRYHRDYRSSRYGDRHQRRRSRDDRDELYNERRSKDWDRRGDRRRQEEEEKRKVKKGRGFMKADKRSALHGWEDDSYQANQRKLK